MDNIAKKFGINVNQFRNVNGLPDAKKLRNAQPVLVPASYSTRTQVIQEDVVGANDKIATSPRANKREARRASVIKKKVHASRKIKIAKNQTRSIKTRSRSRLS